MTKKYILALDQGTTSSKGVILDHQGQVVAVSENFSIEVQSPEMGWVAYDPHEMFTSLVSAGRDAIRKANVQPSDITVIGLANQGETVIAFDKETGEPVSSAISWQDRRTTGIIDRWQEKGWSAEIMEKTGLKLDPYFSAAKMRWILENVPRAAILSEKGRLCLATSDTWLISRLTGLECLVTDLATASRTMLLNLETLEWDMGLLEKLDIPGASLPELVPNTRIIGIVNSEWFGAEIPLGGLCVDQQAALFGQHCFNPGEAKLTYGTGCFMLGNIGVDATRRSTDLLTSVGWQTAGKTQYVFDGGIYTTGAVVDWMINRLKLLESPEEIDQILSDKTPIPELFFIPALSGLAAPYWEPEARGSWYGLTLAHDRRSLVKSAMEGIGFRVMDIFGLMEASGLVLDSIKVDGGLTRNRFLMQLQADLFGIPIAVMDLVEATAIGIGLMSGMAAGIFSSPSDFPKHPPPQEIYRPNDQNRAGILQRYERWCTIARETARWPKQGIGSLI